MKRIHHALFLAAVVLLWNHAAQATDISGTVASTVTITADSRLTGDVRCTVTLAPCIKFGAPGIKLELNGHIMTGNGSRSTCTFSAGEDGILTNGQNAVSIEGPGIVREFQQRGIDVTGNNSTVKHVTVLSSCLESIVVRGSHNLIEDNSVARASIATNFGNIFDASIWVQGTGSHIIRRNEISAAGSITVELEETKTKCKTPFDCEIVTGGGQGIFVGICGPDCTKLAGGTPSTNNVIEENSSSGIPGDGLFFTAGSTGNEVEKNQFLGNLLSDDIFDPNSVGANNYEENLCEVSRVGPEPPPPTPTNVCEIPNIAGHKNPGGDD